jgi:hypothetical protein
MGLPSYYTTDVSLTLLQSNWASLLDPLLDQLITKGQILENIQLANGANTINHKLGRKLLGWFIVRQRALASIYDTQDTNPTPAVTLRLTSDASVKVDIFVF